MPGNHTRRSSNKKVKLNLIDKLLFKKFLFVIPSEQIKV